jgi:hypothetical protein
MNKLVRKPIQYLLEWIVSSSDAEIAVWLDNIIRGARDRIPAEMPPDLTAADIIHDIFHISQSIEIRNKIWFGIAWLTQQINWNSDNLDHLATLLTIIARVKAYNTVSLLLKLAHRGLLKERKFPSGSTLHTYLLVSLSAFPCDRQISSVFLRDIHTPEYAPISFRSLWPYDVNTAIELSYVIVRFAAKKTIPNFPAQILFREFAEKNSLQIIWNLINTLFKSVQLNDSEKMVFYQMLDSGGLGFEISKKSSYIILSRKRNGKVDKIFTKDADVLLFNLKLEMWSRDFSSLYTKNTAMIPSKSIPPFTGYISDSDTMVL